MSAFTQWVGANQTEVVGNWPQDKAISYIQDGTYVFYIEKPGGYRVDVIVATSSYGNYLKTVADREQPDKLLSLRPVPRLRRNV